MMLLLTGDDWRLLQLTVDEVLRYELTTKDILQPGSPTGSTVASSVLRGRLQSACFEEDDYPELVRGRRLP